MPPTLLQTSQAVSNNKGSYKLILSKLIDFRMSNHKIFLVNAHLAKLDLI